MGVYAQIAPHSRLAIWNFIDVGVGFINSDYWVEIKILLFNQFAEDFDMKASDQIAQLILERVKTPHIQKVAARHDTNRGVGGLGNVGM